MAGKFVRIGLLRHPPGGAGLRAARFAAGKKKARSFVQVISRRNTARSRSIVRPPRSSAELTSRQPFAVSGIFLGERFDDSRRGKRHGSPPSAARFSPIGRCASRNRAVGVSAPGAATKRARSCRRRRFVRGSRPADGPCVPPGSAHRGRLVAVLPEAIDGRGSRTSSSSKAFQAAHTPSMHDSGSIATK